MTTEKKADSKWPWVVFGFMGLLVLITVLGAVDTGPPSPQTLDRRAYGACMDSLKDNDRARAGNGNFIAGACEKMRNDYIGKYGNTP